MNKNDEEFLKRISETFRVEAEEHIRAFTAGLFELEKTSSKKRKAEITETLFREIHSLKGAARSVDRKEIESLCHPIENLLSALKRNIISLTPQSFDMLFKAAGRISGLVALGGKSESRSDLMAHDELISSLRSIAEGSEISFPSMPPDAVTISGSSDGEIYSGIGKQTTDAMTLLQKPHAEMVRIPVARLDNLLLQAEEMIQTKISLDQRIKELKEIKSGIDECKADIPDWKFRRKLIASNQWAELAGASKESLNNFADQLTKLIRAMERDHYSFSRLVNDHIDDMKQSVMLPVSTIVESFPLMVKEISRQVDKVIDIVIYGSDLEVDKRILEEFKDPLIHLIRNSIDHGIG
ncbi:MAG: Hpt domain-containing protein, partial [Bacteroidales bacterium]